MGIILLGSFLLFLPLSSKSGDTPYLTCLFTSTSAVCVTGLTVTNTLAHWTGFGHAVILGLIQVGALGLVSLAVTAVMLAGKRISLKSRMMLSATFNQDSIHGMVRLLRRAVAGTFAAEGAGALLLSARFIPAYGWGKGIWLSVFHSVSAFCNAGFDLIGEASLVPWNTDAVVLVTIMALIVLGGLGFPVWADALSCAKASASSKSGLRGWLRGLKLHTKLALFSTALLISLGALFFMFSEARNPDTTGGMSWGAKALNGAFASVTARTAGFASVDYAGMNGASKLMTIILMFIGGSPAGTAGGIKTTTLAVLVASVISVARGRAQITAFRRSIAFHVLGRALSVMMMMLGVVLGATMLLTLTESSGQFLDYFFEVVSAIGTVGLTTGITPLLTTAGRVVIISVMFIGRVGPLALVTSLVLRHAVTNDTVQHPEAHVIIG